MHKKTLPRLNGAGWSHPYGHAPFSPFLYADGSGEEGGGSGSGGQAGTGESGGSGEGGGGGTTEGAGQGGQQSGQSGSGEQAGSGGGTDWEAKYRETLAHSRDWEKRAKANNTAATELEKLKAASMTEQEKAVAEAEKAGRTAAAQEAQAEIEKRDARLRELTVKDAVRDLADKHGAKAGALLDSLSFRERIADLDPAAKGFQTALGNAIKDAVKENKAFAAVEPAGKSGGDLSGGTGEGAAKRSGSLAGAISNHYQT